MFNTKVNRLRHIIALAYFLFFQIEFINSQSILNGNFEDVNSPTGNSLELPDNQLNNLVSHCYFFSNLSNQYTDLISTDCPNQTPCPQNGNWYVGIQTKEQFSIELSDSLEVGQSYKLSFYAQGFIKTCPASIEIGVSEYKNSFGTSVYISPFPSDEKWDLMLLTFTSPIKAKYITVKALKCSDSGSGWTGVDDFCIGVDKYCIDLPEIEMPNVFTPNNDGVNDLFTPVVFKGMESGNITILNRWGNVIYESNDLSKGWDGTFQNKPVSDGVYFYKIHYKTIFEDEEIKYGSFHLFR